MKRTLRGLFNYIVDKPLWSEKTEKEFIDAYKDAKNKPLFSEETKKRYK